MTNARASVGRILGVYVLVCLAVFGATRLEHVPVIGEYVAKRVLDMDDQPELAEGFRLSEEEFDEAEEERRRRRGEDFEE